MQSLLISVVGIFALLVTGDLTYSTIVRHRLAKYEQSIVRDDKGVRLGCREFTTGEGETAVLLIHGFAESPASFASFAKKLADHGFTCRCMRLPGFGEPMSVYRQTSLRKWLSATAREVSVLREKHDRLWLLGHSLGGAVATRYALDNPDSVDGLVLLAPLLKVSGERSPVLSPHCWHKLGQYCLPITDVLENCLPVDASDPEAREKCIRDRFIPGVVYRELFCLIEDLAGRTRLPGMPVFMVLAEKDRVVDNVAALEMFGKCAAEQKRLASLTRSGHAIPLDSQWQEVVLATAGFIQDSTPGSAP